ncbi:AGC protein kinase [Aphanomyces invadans]|uniref:AGC protein kinase n=1 Tax=Aphanomyces invadans TaxID=157072 RepID=A0A024UPH4_9STRA|nr:AGC protein kinase [Aphanomyces invadans]ETW07747.1 AGC protein kinase [Aphanomyces invadans]|eukprot:XP_008863840.1 AGC protein kinase [Aphanomyces invadans]
MAEEGASVEPSTPRVDTLTPLIEKESAAFETSTAATISNKPVRRGSKEQCAVDRGKKSSTDASATPTDFELLVVVGQGAFGKVIQVRHKPSGEIYAMKIVSKEYLVKKNYIGNMQTERDIMTKVDHPFLVKLKYAFQSPANVYLVMPYIPGGELFHTLHKQGLLLEHTACFYAAEMVLALEYLHGQGIIHRDLKPENILLDADGHVCLTDFGLSKELPQDDEAKTVCGTNEYMAPEMIRNKPYSHAVDWWALGALIYEMVTGYPPFRHNNRKKLLEKICNEKLSLPKFLHADTHSILKQLLERNVDKRLGSGKSTMFKVKGVAAIKQHPFFKSIDWGLLAQRRLTPPVKPSLATDNSNLDTSCFAESFTKMQVTVDDSHHLDHGTLFHRFSFTAADVRMRRESDSRRSKNHRNDDDGCASTPLTTHNEATFAESPRHQDDNEISC